MTGSSVGDVSSTVGRVFPFLRIPFRESLDLFGARETPGSSPTVMTLFSDQQDCKKWQRHDSKKRTHIDVLDPELSNLG